MKLQVALLLLVFAVFSCGGGADTSSDTPAKKETPAAKKEAKKAPKPAAAAVDSTFLDLASNDQMRYDQEKLTAKAGTYIVLTLTHTGKLNKSVMGHNFVLLKEGTDVASFAAEAIKAAADGYVPKSDAIIANTEMIGGGESTTVRFPAPEKGTYQFICTFPGHYALMKGELIIY